MVLSVNRLGSFQGASPYLDYFAFKANRASIGKDLAFHQDD